MPQLMPLVWSCSFIMGSFIFFVLVDMYMNCNFLKFYNLEGDNIKLMLNWKW